VKTGEPAPEFIRARQLRIRHDIPLTAVANLMRQLLGRPVAFSGISDWERGLTRPRDSEKGRQSYLAWREAMRVLVATAIVEELSSRAQSMEDGPMSVYKFTESRKTMLRNSPCGRSHTYLIELNDGAADNFTDVETARALYLAITDEWKPVWRACHDDGSECLLEAAFQTAMSVKEVFIHGGEDPANPDLRRGQLIGVFIVRLADLLEKCWGGELRAYMEAIRDYVLRDLPTEDRDLFRDLIGWLEAIDKSELIDFPSQLPSGVEPVGTYGERARAAIRSLLT
jgi:hypothetical protein